MPDTGDNGHNASDEPSWPEDVETPGGPSQPDIELLLDAGYEQIDLFTEWLEDRLGLDLRTIHRDTFNVEALMDFLANRYVKTPAEANEFELRSFVFSYYIRNSLADAETAVQLPDSLQRFYDFLRSEEAFLQPAWLPAVIDDREHYLARRAAYIELEKMPEEEWTEGYSRWRMELEDDLNARCLLPPNDIGDGPWSETMGWRESTLRTEAEERWQEERQELLDQGWDFERIQERLTASYELWLETPDDRLDGMTPREVILAERETAQFRSDEDEPDET
jgi:hypothetical protein